MAQMDQILGAILRDIAKARAMADLYSRELSRLYEKDSVLRLFPVPRVDIKESAMDLRFAISSVAVDAERREHQDAQTLRLLESAGARLADALLGSLAQANPMSQEWQAFTRSVVTTEFRQSLRAAFIKFLEENAGLWTGDKDQEEVYEFCQQIPRQSLNWLRELQPAFSENLEKRCAFGNLGKAVAAALLPILVALDDEIRLARQSAEDYKVEIEVQADKLKELPEAAISTLHLALGVRNYEWVKVEEKAGESIHRLTPE